MEQTPNPVYIEEVKKVVKDSPYPKHMSMVLVDLAIDRATVELNLNNNHLQPFGIVHGGVLATLVDTATFWAVFMRLPEQSGLVNVDLKLNYLKRVTTGLLRAEGSTIKSGSRISYSEARIFDEKGNIVVHGTSTLMSLKKGGLTISVPKFI